MEEEIKLNGDEYSLECDDDEYDIDKVLNKYENIYISIKTDIKDIRYASVWSIGLWNSQLNKALYIEPKMIRSEKVPVKIWEKLNNESYFLCLAEADANIGGTISDQENFKINIFTNEMDKCINKIKSYFNEVEEKSNKPIRLVFESSFDYVMFMNYFIERENIEDEIKPYKDMASLPIVMENMCSITNTWDAYKLSLNKWIANSRETIGKLNGEKNSEEVLMFDKLQSVIKAMAIGDLYRFFI